MTALMYSFSLEFTDPELERFVSTRIHTARHHGETLEQLHARVLAFAHCFREGLTFSQGMWEPDQPTIWAKDMVGEVLCWVDVGNVKAERLRKAHKRHRKAEFRVYWYDPSHREYYRHSLRGERREQQPEVKFLSIARDFLSVSSESDARDSQWELTFAYNVIYARINGRYIESSIEEIGKI